MKKIIGFLYICFFVSLSYAQFLEIVSYQDFEEKVIKNNRPVVVEMYGKYCMPCKRMNPILKKLAAEFDGSVDVLKMDIDLLDQEAIQLLSVRAVPTFLFYKKGNLVQKLVGKLSERDLRTKMKQLLA
jgi:thioredoxin 1